MRSLHLPLVPFALAAFASFHALPAGEITLSPAKDSTLFAGSPPFADQAGGGDEYLFSGQTANKGARRILMEFDLVPLTDAEVTSATLTLHFNKASNEVQWTHSLYRVTSRWSEGSANDAGQGGGGVAPSRGDVTWNFRVYPAEEWFNVGGDFDARLIDSSDVGGEVTKLTFTGPELVRVLNFWLSDPCSNHGFLIRGTEGSPGSAQRFSSREDATPEVRPSLSIEFNDLHAVKDATLWQAR
jgi:hypothetical protein